MNIVLDNDTVFTTSLEQDNDLIARLSRKTMIDLDDIEIVVNIMYRHRYLRNAEKPVYEKCGIELTFSDINIITGWIDGLYSEDQKKIEYLKHTLYGYGAISDEEQEEAKTILANTIDKSAPLLEKLKIMIKIKEQIVQRHTKRFDIDDSYLAIDPIIDKEVFANFDNGVIYLSGGISTVLIHDDKQFMEELLYYQEPRNRDNMRGFWSLSKDLTTLIFSHYLDKLSSNDKRFYSTN